jgi:hypothetical protein
VDAELFMQTDGQADGRKDGQTEERTDTHGEVNNHFSQFCESA